MKSSKFCLPQLELETMFDRVLRHGINGPLNACGRAIARRGITADQVTAGGFGFGCAAAAVIAAGAFKTGLFLILLNRLADGLDGAVARATHPTDRGGFLDIALDFAFYATIPVAFAITDPERNGLPASILLASFLMNGSAFFAFALMAGQRGLQTSAQGLKSMYYVAGLAEGGETIAAFSLFCLFPQSFPWLAAGFSALCMASALGRIVLAWRTFC
jgi:phosphatidylglycerophosphate synthase